jgi:DNA-binding CsgD family transcriptional regulator
MQEALGLFSSGSSQTAGAVWEIDASQLPANIGVGHVALNVFDQLSVGIVLVNRFAEVVFANTAAQAIAESGGSLRLNGGVRSHSSSHDRRLGELVRSAISGTSARAMSLPSSDSGRSVTVLAAPVQDPGTGHASVRNLRSAAALLVICDPDRLAQIPAAWMMDAYGLTLAEVKVALTIASGDTIPGMARRLKVAPNTIKTHLRRAYEKTATNSRAELSRLVTTIGLLLGSEAQAWGRMATRALDAD